MGDSKEALGTFTGAAFAASVASMSASADTATLANNFLSGRDLRFIKLVFSKVIELLSIGISIQRGGSDR